MGFFKPKAEIVERDDGDINVNVYWTGSTPLDRPHTFGWGFRGDRRGRALAARLVRAVNAGAVFGVGVLARDVGGQTYVQASCHVYGRTMNADLKKLGY